MKKAVSKFLSAILIVSLIFESINMSASTVLAAESAEVVEETKVEITELETEETSTIVEETSEQETTVVETEEEQTTIVEETTEEQIPSVSDNNVEEVAPMASSLDSFNFIERAKANRVYMRESSSCAIASVASIEAYVANIGLSEEEQKSVYEEVKRKNGGLYAYWWKMGYVSVSTSDYNALYQKLKETQKPVVVHRTTGGSHYSVVVGFEDKNNNSIPEANEFLVMESQKRIRIYDGAVGYIDSWHNNYGEASKVPLNEWQAYAGWNKNTNQPIYNWNAKFDQIVYRTSGMTLDSLKDEPAESLKIVSTKPEGNLTKGSTFTITGYVESNNKIGLINAGIYQGSKAICTFGDSDFKRYRYSWGAHTDLDNAMMFSTLEEGDYEFRIMVTDAGGVVETLVSKFTVVAKKNQSNVQTPTLSLNNKFDYLDETSAERTALLKNPGKQKISQSGMVLYDQNKNEIARCSENLNSYSSELWLYYATNNRTKTNLNIKLIPGTKYYYDIYTTVGNKVYTVSGEFETPGTPKPATPTLSITQTEYATGDAATVTWNEVDYVTDGYQVVLSAVDGSYEKEVDTKMTTASFVLPNEGEYNVYIIAKGYEWSDVGYLSQTIKAFGNRTVTFVLEKDDGITEVLKEETVKYKTNASAPPVPSKTGWIFQGWDKSFLNVTENVVIKAMFVRNKYTVKFQDPNGVVIKEARVAYEDSVEPPTEIEVPDGYVFVGWDNEDYKYVTKNTTVTASFVYENENLPLQLVVTSCGFDSDGTGYTVLYNVTNYNQGITKGRAIVSLMSSDGRLLYTTESNAFTLKASQVKNNVEVFVPFEGEAAYAEVVIVDDFTSSIPLSEKKTIDVVRTWSAWSTQAPPAGATEVESRVEYRYQDKSTTVSNSSSLDGWNYESTEGYWGAYGAWSGWSRNQYYASDSRQVETTTVVDQAGYTLQEYYFYKYYKDGAGWMYSYTNRSGTPGVSQVEFRNIWINTSGDSRQMIFNRMDDGYELYTCNPYQFYKVEYFYKGSGVQHIPAVTHTEWRCRDRQYLYRYHFYKWSDWSSWSTTPYTQSSTRNVETRTVYRYKTTAIPNDAWDGETYTISGSVNSSLAGKQALLVVYKGLEPSDYNNEYLGQTVIGEDGSYSFTFLTREKPSVETGDFTVKLGIEGAKELLYIQTIAAPKPTYNVKFLDWDGKVLSEQSVKEGDSAQAPTVAERKGYRFMGWDTGLTNVHADMQIMAMYEREQCTVTFIDWSQNTCLTEIYDVGADIIYPSWKEIEGYEFQGWFDENGNEITIAEENLVLTAKYIEKEFVVTFYSQAGEVLSSETVKYGDAAYPPVAPEIEGQRFACWSTYEYSNVKETLDIFPSYEYYETTLNPVADKKSCTLEEPIKVTLSCEDENATIYYTMDGTKPDIFSTEYTEPITIQENVVLQFFARSDNKNDSDIVSEAYLMMNAEDDQGAISIKKDQLNLLLGEEAPQITYFLYHEDPDMGVDFYSLDESVVTVDEEGQLFINNVGETQVFVVTKDYRYADYCDIKVTSSEVAIETMDLSSSSIKLYIGDESDLQTNITPSNATYQDVVWSTGNSKVVSIDQEGHLVANAPGNTYITAYSHSGTNIAYCYVAVEDSTLQLSDYEIVLAAGQQYQLSATMTRGEQKVTWKTDNKNVISVSESGLVTAFMPGLATVLATAENGDFRSCVVRVTSGEAPQKTPDAPIIEQVTATTITVAPQENCEYSLNAINWRESNVFTGLTPDTTYSVYCRWNKEISGDVNLVSEPTSVKTLSQGISVVDVKTQEYTGKAIKPVVDVYYGDELLTLGQDYSVSYKNNVNVSVNKPTITIKGKGYYSSSIKTNFEIVAKNISDEEVLVDNMLLSYNKKEQKKIPTLVYNGKKLTNNKDFTVRYISEGEGAYLNPGVYDIEITGKGNFKGSRIVQMEITDKTFISKAKISATKKLEYNGKAQEIEATITYKGEPLAEGKDYKIEYPSLVDGAYKLPGTYPVNIVGMNDFVGSKTVNVKITGISIKNAEVNGIEEICYTGDEIKQDKMKVLFDGKLLTEDLDYTVVYNSNVKAGKASVEIIGKNGYEGKVKKSFKILPYDILADVENLIEVELTDTKIFYTKGGVKPSFTVKYEENILVEGKDYTVKYLNNKAVNDGTDEKKVPTIRITGKGNFKGTIDEEFVIETQNLSKLDMQVEDVIFKNKVGAYKAKPVIYDLDGKKLSVNKDYSKNYSYSYADGTPIGVNEIPEAGSEIKITVDGAGYYNGEISVNYRVVEKNISKVKVNKPKKTYTGQAIEISEKEIIVKDGNYTLVEGRDYVILEDTYIRNVSPGTASVTIQGIGTYGGKKKINFTIEKKKFVIF